MKNIEIQNPVSVLVVDEEEIIRDMVSGILSKEGYEVDTAESGAEALPKLLANRYKICITNHNMPEISGAELIKQFRREYKNTTKFIGLTGSDAATAREEYSPINVPLLGKPFTAKEIINFAGIVSGKKKGILYAEYDDDNYALADHILSGKGHSVIRARDGSEAFDLFNSLEGNLSLVLAGTRLSRIDDGYELARTINDIDNTIPIIALTADAGDRDKRRCLSSGFADYISKPYDARGLVDIVNQHTRQER